QPPGLLPLDRTFASCSASLNTAPVVDPTRQTAPRGSPPRESRPSFVALHGQVRRRHDGRKDNAGCPLGYFIDAIPRRSLARQEQKMAIARGTHRCAPPSARNRSERITFIRRQSYAQMLRGAAWEIPAFGSRGY